MQCGASITSHTPLLFGGFANKLRGFEIDHETDHLLLLDSDVMILSDITDLPDSLASDCIAAAAANGPCRVASEHWRKIHEALELPYPEGRVIPLNLELDTFQCAPYRHRSHDDLPPYYNGGIVYAPWASGLGGRWLDHLMRIYEIAPDIKGPGKLVSNQPSLATSVHELQLQGVNFRLLPPEYHARWQHLAAGALTVEETKIMHLIGLGRWSSGANRNTAKEDIEIYLANTLRLTRQLCAHRGPFTRLFHRLTRHRQMREFHRVYEMMNMVYDKHISTLRA